MDFSKLMAVVFGVLFIIILYFIIYYALKIMYKDVKVNSSAKSNRKEKAKIKKVKTYGIEVVSSVDDLSLKPGTIIPVMDIVTLGRKEDNSIVLKDKHVSSNHAKLMINNGVLFIEDLASTNGTFVNGRKIVSIVKLSGKEEIKIGTTVFKVL